MRSSQPPNRILAIDYGERRIGLAISDALRLTAQGLPTLDVPSRKKALRAIQEIIAEYQVNTLVVGLPRNMDGTEGPEAEKVRTFARRLAGRTGAHIIFWDERLTTRAALRTMQEIGIKSKGQKGQIDRIAATLMLEEYLSRP